MFDFIKGDIKKGSKPNEYFTCCPFCEERAGSPDKKFHLGFNTKKSMWHCFRCGASPKTTNTSISSLQEMASLQDQDASMKKLQSKLFSLSSKKNSDIDLDRISWKICPQVTPLAFQYMVERGFSFEEVEFYQLRVGKEFMCPDKKTFVKRWKGRVLFPFFDSNNNCVFVCGRSYLGHSPKYINSAGSKKSVVYGLDRIKNKEVILTEGIISAIAAERVTGIAGVCLLGKSNNDWALSKIRAKANKIYISLDGGVKEETKELKKRLFRLGFDVFEVELPEGKDPDDLKEEYARFFALRKKIKIA